MTYRTLLFSLLIVAASFITPPLIEAEGYIPPETGKIPIAFVLTEHANLIDFAGPWEVFSSVRVPGRGNSKNEDTPEDDQYPFQLFTIGDSVSATEISIGLTVIPSYTFETAPIPVIVVVGAQKGSPAMKTWLQKVAVDPHNQIIMSVCTGAFRLASAGLLENKAATTHHAYYDSFSQLFPNVRLQKGKRYVQSDSRIFTAGGLTSGIDLALHIVDLYFGEKVAQQTADWVEYQSASWKTDRN